MSHLEDHTQPLLPRWGGNRKERSVQERCTARQPRPVTPPGPGCRHLKLLNTTAMNLNTLTLRIPYASARMLQGAEPIVSSFPSEQLQFPSSAPPPPPRPGRVPFGEDGEERLPVDFDY